VPACALCTVTVQCGVHDGSVRACHTMHWQPEYHATPWHAVRRARSKLLCVHHCHTAFTGTWHGWPPLNTLNATLWHPTAVMHTYINSVTLPAVTRTLLPCASGRRARAGGTRTCGTGCPSCPGCAAGPAGSRSVAPHTHAHTHAHTRTHTHTVAHHTHTSHTTATRTQPQRHIHAPAKQLDVCQ